MAGVAKGRTGTRLLVPLGPSDLSWQDRGGRNSGKPIGSNKNGEWDCGRREPVELLALYARGPGGVKTKMTATARMGVVRE